MRVVSGKKKEAAVVVEQIEKFLGWNEERRSETRTRRALAARASAVHCTLLPEMEFQACVDVELTCAAHASQKEMRGAGSSYLNYAG